MAKPGTWTEAEQEVLGYLFGPTDLDGPRLDSGIAERVTPKLWLDFARFVLDNPREYAQFAVRAAQLAGWFDDRRSQSVETDPLLAYSQVRLSLDTLAVIDRRLSWQRAAAQFRAAAQLRDQAPLAPDPVLVEVRRRSEEIKPLLSQWRTLAGVAQDVARLLARPFIRDRLATRSQIRNRRIASVLIAGGGLQTFFDPLGWWRRSSPSPVVYPVNGLVTAFDPVHPSLTLSTVRLGFLPGDLTDFAVLDLDRVPVGTRAFFAVSGMGLDATGSGMCAGAAIITQIRRDPDGSLLVSKTSYLAVISSTVGLTDLLERWAAQPGLDAPFVEFDSDQDATMVVKVLPAPDRSSLFSMTTEVSIAGKAYSGPTDLVSIPAPLVAMVGDFSGALETGPNQYLRLGQAPTTTQFGQTTYQQGSGPALPWSTRPGAHDNLADPHGTTLRRRAYPTGDVIVVNVSQGIRPLLPGAQGWNGVGPRHTGGEQTL